MAESASKLRYANFSKIKTGMSAAEVVQILGDQGEILSVSESGAGTDFHVKTVMVQWQEGLSSCNVMFQNGKVVTKAQFGLQ